MDGILIGNEDNLTDECILNISVPVDLDSVKPEFLIFHACILSVLVASSLLINCLVIILVCKYKTLRVRSVLLTVSLTAADVMLTLSYTMPSLVTTIAKRWVFTDTGCTAFGFIAYEFLMTRWLIMGLLCLDRFCTVRFPFRYHMYSKKILVMLTIIAWIVPFLLSAAIFHGIGEGMLRQGGPTCLPTCVNDRRCQLYYAACVSITFFIGGILPVILYAWMFHRGRKMSTIHMGALSATVAGGGVAIRRSFSHPLDNQEKRALVTFIILLVTVLVTGTPAYVLQIVRTSNVGCRIPIYVSFILTALLMSGSSLNAFVVMRDRDFRMCLKKFFRISSQTKDSFASDSTCRTSSSPNIREQVICTSVAENGFTTAVT